jgi:hypothetical protein
MWTPRNNVPRNNEARTPVEAYVSPSPSAVHSILPAVMLFSLKQSDMWIPSNNVYRDTKARTPARVYVSPSPFPSLSAGHRDSVHPTAAMVAM